MARWSTWLIAGGLSAVLLSPAAAQRTASHDSASPNASAASSSNDQAILKQLNQLNQVAQSELNERTDPGFAILKSIYDTDGPEFLSLRKLVSQASVRSTLNPTVKCVVANILSQRWDTFPLCGNLWLAGLQSPNPDWRAKARKKLVAFIQPAHIPELIDLMRVPGPNVLAFEVLGEVTGQNLGPNVNAWRAWWKKTHGKFDFLGHLLKDTRGQIAQHPIRGFDQERFWHAPPEIEDAHTEYEKRPAAEQAAVSRFNDWANTEVRSYVEGWSETKPLLDRISHQPDSRVNDYLEELVADPGYGDYASAVLASRKSVASLPVIQKAYGQQPTVGRALARGSLGDKGVLRDLLVRIEQNPQPSSYALMNDHVRDLVKPLSQAGVISPEQAFELLSHQFFNLASAQSRGDKKKAVRKAARWLDEHK